MKKLILIFVFGCISFFCPGQDNQDSVSRRKADALLSKFDSLQVSKLLYCISDEHYFLVLQKKKSYIEYYIHLDSIGGVIEKRELKSYRNKRKILKNAFDLTKYGRGFITSIKDATIVQGNKSYFVIKDKYNIRYGEYLLSVLTSPIPINGAVYKYLLSRLLKETVGNVSN